MGGLHPDTVWAVRWAVTGVVGRSQWLHEYLEDVRLDSRARPGSAKDTRPDDHPNPDFPRPEPPTSPLHHTAVFTNTAKAPTNVGRPPLKKAKMNASAPGRKLALCVPESPHPQVHGLRMLWLRLRRLLVPFGTARASDVRTYPTLSDTLKHVETSVQDKFRRRIWWRGTSGLQQRSHGLSARGIDGKFVVWPWRVATPLVSEVLDPLRPLASAHTHNTRLLHTLRLTTLVHLPCTCARP